RIPAEEPDVEAGPDAEEEDDQGPAIVPEAGLDADTGPTSCRDRTSISKVSSAYDHTCAVLAQGGVRCWGLNATGELGDGTQTSTFSAPTMDVLGGAQAVVTGPGYTCALLISGGVRCWGLNDSGQLGDGTTDTRLFPPTTDILTGVR